MSKTAKAPQRKPPGMEPGATSRPTREPIPVGILKFPASAPVQVPGSFSSSLTNRKRAGHNHSRHEIEYHPWFRAFCITHFPPDRDPEAVFVPEAKVECWYPLKTEK